MTRPIITIDGPAGAGKTTVSRTLASRLGFTYVDTGALYRGLAVMALRAGLAMDDDEALAKLCQGLALSFDPSCNPPALLANGENITGELRTPTISMAASAVSARPLVRQWLLSVQRDLGAAGGAVFEGRDMGTVVFPQARFKFFLTADLATRAKRRHLELLALGTEISLEKVMADMETRDANDSSRQIAPLAAAPDAVHMDSSGLSAEQVVEKMARRVNYGK